MTGVWWCVAESDLMNMLNAVAAGEDPDLVYAEAFANSHVETAEEDPDV